MSNTEIWETSGRLIPISEITYDGENKKDVCVIIVNRDRPDLTDQLVEQIPKVKGDLSVDIVVVEMGSTKQSKHASLWYEDPDYKGKAYGHNVGIRYAKAQGKYKYYFIAMNDIIFKTKLGLKKLVEMANQFPELAILSPTEPDSGYAGGICKPIKGQKFHSVSQCNYLGMLMRAECVDNIGFLNPDFKYCWGAIHELAYKLYLEKYKVAYCDTVQMKHFGGTTYGKVKNTIPRAEYLKNAKTFAARYMVANYGKNWDKQFSAALHEDVRFDTYSMHRKRWEAALEPHERKLYNIKAKDKIDALNPWYYPVVIGNRVVRPGIGSKQSPQSLIERTKYRKKLLIDEVRKLYDFEGKKLLDVASNCAYWSSLYVEICGAKSVVAVEGRLDYVKQGQLYWGENNFTKNYAFIHRNVLDDGLWDEFHMYNEEFDFTLCAGILYHIDKYEKLLQRICSYTKEAVLIDTRVGKEERTVQEPGGFCFDAIEQTSKKSIPTVENIKRIMKECGFQKITQIKIGMPLPKGMASHDNYDKGRRVCLLCER